MTYVMEATNLSKTFGSQTVLDGVNIQLKPGEVRGLMGQNGSGKSTLVKILAGFHEPDAGAQLRIRDRTIEFPLAPGESQSSGIGIVHQDLGLVGSLTVWENLSIGALGGGRAGLVSPRRLKEATAAALAEFGLHIDPEAQVRDLSRMERATIAIVRASRQSRLADGEQPNVLVLDETSAFLPLEERQQLYALVRQFATGGGAVLYVAHDLEEVLTVADSMTVLRDGRAVATMETADTSIPEVISLMIGGANMVAHTRNTRALSANAGPAVTARAVATSVLSPSDFTVFPGEILGVTGLVGSGVDELPYALFGADPSAMGSLTIGQTVLDLARVSTAKAMRAGIALVPGDRAAAGGIADLPAFENITMPTLARRKVGGIIRTGILAAQSRVLVQDYGVKPASETAPFGSFSGGNQQKMILAKWLETRPKFLILHEPVQGVDVAARADLLRRISTSAETGLPILCISTDAVLLAELCSRVLVLAYGRFVGELKGDEVTEESITVALLGERKEESTTTPGKKAANREN